MVDKFHWEKANRGKKVEQIERTEFRRAKDAAAAQQKFAHHWFHPFSDYPGCEMIEACARCGFGKSPDNINSRCRGLILTPEQLLDYEDAPRPRGTITRIRG
ncbi:hypothetical protein [Rhodopila sp.]|uniref:hypothetical protein n=1 Tax=Rhodopila sp. TaxID=2480087 RepID=UPI003D0CE5FC